MKKFKLLMLILINVGGMIISCTGPKTNKQTDNSENLSEDLIPPAISDTSVSADLGWVQLFQDINFEKGFHSDYIYGETYSVETAMKKGNALTYIDIGTDIYCIKDGFKTVCNNSDLTANGVTEDIYWEWGEGDHQGFIDLETGNIPESGFHENRFNLFPVIIKNDENEFSYAHYNDYYHEKYPFKFPSDPKMVKKVTTNRKGTIKLEYNTFNEISNKAYNYSDFTTDTWPHFLLCQNFKEWIDLGQFSKIEWEVTSRVTKADKINKWPQGPSERADQPMPPEDKINSGQVAPSNACYQSFFLARHKINKSAFFFGVMFYCTEPAYYNEIYSHDQHGQIFFRVGINGGNKYIPVEGRKMRIGGEFTTMKVDLIEMLNYIFIYKMQRDEEIVDGQPNPYYGAKLEDYYLDGFNLGWENIGNWDCEIELEKISAKAYYKE